MCSYLLLVFYSWLLYCNSFVDCQYLFFRHVGRIAHFWKEVEEIEQRRGVRPPRKLWHLLIKVFSKWKIMDYVEHLIAEHALGARCKMLMQMCNSLFQTLLPSFSQLHKISKVLSPFNYRGRLGVTLCNPYRNLAKELVRNFFWS